VGAEAVCEISHCAPEPDIKRAKVNIETIEVLDRQLYRGRIGTESDDARRICKVLCVTFQYRAVSM
jgi:hypothetical protein